MMRFLFFFSAHFVVSRRANIGSGLLLLLNINISLIFPWPPRSSMSQKLLSKRLFLPVLYSPAAQPPVRFDPLRVSLLLLTLLYIAFLRFLLACPPPPPHDCWYVVELLSFSLFVVPDSSARSQHARPPWKEWFWRPMRHWEVTDK